MKGKINITYLNDFFLRFSLIQHFGLSALAGLFMMDKPDSTDVVNNNRKSHSHTLTISTNLISTETSFRVFLNYTKDYQESVKILKEI